MLPLLVKPDSPMAEVTRNIKDAKTPNSNRCSVIISVPMTNASVVVVGIPHTRPDRKFLRESVPSTVTAQTAESQPTLQPASSTVPPKVSAMSNQGTTTTVLVKTAEAKPTPQPASVTTSPEPTTAAATIYGLPISPVTAEAQQTSQSASSAAPPIVSTMSARGTITTVLATIPEAQPTAQPASITTSSEPTAAIISWLPIRRSVRQPNHLKDFLVSKSSKKAALR
ncbi:cytadherence high molecular weight protein 3-like [Schistocerca gregaria]|uniref:cytadherence high molecular weight protein 3-like n=1 Tax=Schistocerca gregaria TaxID=7010 RepID=UPI00211F3F84|nr:cytadherence high molecular weight protein 3-like [Schistocerca gregaria]